MQSTRIPGIYTSRGFRVLAAAILSTCTITNPREFLAAMAIARLSSVRASRSIVMFPAGSAVVPLRSRDADWEGFVTQPFLVIDVQELDEVFRRLLVKLTPFKPRIDKCAQPDFGNGTGAAGGNASIEMRNAPEGQVVSLDAVRKCKFAQSRHQRPVP